MATKLRPQEVAPSPDVLECPNPSCRMRGLVRCVHDDDDVWKCLYCGHTVNLTTGTQTDRISPLGFLFAILIAVGLVMALSI